MRLARGVPPLLSVLALAGPAGCGSPDPAATRKTVFDPGAMAAAAPVDVSPESAPLEQPYPPFDREGVAGQAKWVGVSVLHGGVRFSRPSRWIVRDAAVDPGRSYIAYVSPTGAYAFGIYERSDAPTDLWKDIERRYENDVASAGAKLLGQRIPVATDTNQGRAYTVSRKVESGKASLTSRSREVLLRSDHRVVLVQIVAQDDAAGRLGAELLEVLRHIEVL